MSERESITLEAWIGGVNSMLHPSMINPQEYAWAENVITRGGIPQTRPGFRLLADLSGSLLQGMTMFRPEQSRTYMIIAIDGKLYRAQPPYKEFKLIEGVSLLPDAAMVTFQACLQSAETKEDGTLSLIDPKRVLIIQDGGTRPVVWDGSKARHLDPSAFHPETPVGLWMAWASNRLWVARGAQVFVSDIANPTQFTEDQYLAEKSGFILPDNCTGLVETPDHQGLLAFTSETTTAFQASIRDRATWQTVANFQKLLLSGVGCIAGKSITTQYGLTYWLSRQGLVALDAALQSQQTSRLQTSDGEMMRSKRKMAPEISGACGVAHDNLLLISVPSSDRHNSHTWVQDQAPTGPVNAPKWMGIWTGVRPVQWASCVLVGRRRLYFASYGATPRNGNRVHVFEAMDDSREDNFDSRIKCQWESVMVSNPVNRRFSYAELDLCEILGRVSLKVYFGGVKGPWVNVLDTELSAIPGSIDASGMIEKNGTIQTYKPQCRTVRTKDWSPQDHQSLIETNRTAGIDKSHAILVQWQGRMGIQRVRMITAAESRSETGHHPSIEHDGEILLESGESP